MSNQTVLSSGKKGSINSNNSVKKSFLKTQCIVCNTLFTKPRVGKMYCSNRCKQFGYNHKGSEKKINLLNEEPKTFKKRRININEYFCYREMIEQIKRFKELTRRNCRFQEEDIKIRLRENMGIPQSPESIILYNVCQLREDELDELEILKDKVSNFSNFESQNLSLEKWSFFKIMNPKLDFENLFKLICQFSSEYISQLNFIALDPDETVDNLGIKKKYIEHCNAINEGVIQFYNKIK
ncbi:MAG: hypothetical protein ACK4X2_04255 [Bacteroidota bacterium]